MKRISFLLVTLALWTTPMLRADDAATEERLNKLAGRIDDLTAGQEALRKQIQALEREVESLREQMAKPAGTYASPEDLKRLAETVKEVDRKRIEDAERIHTELLKVAKAVTAPAPPTRKPPPGSAAERSPTEPPATPEKGFGEYTVQKGDTISLIVQAYRDKNIKLTTDQILKANPGLKPEKLHVGQKIWIPAPAS
jgi:LysM repeat protein